MTKKPFTTRLDEEVLALAQRLADTERRSVTSLIEIAVLEYAARHRAPPASQDNIQVRSAAPLDAAANYGPRTKAWRTKKNSAPNPPTARGRASRDNPGGNE